MLFQQLVVDCGIYRSIWFQADHSHGIHSLQLHQEKPQEKEILDWSLNCW